MWQEGIFRAGKAKLQDLHARQIETVAQFARHPG